MRAVRDRAPGGVNVDAADAVSTRARKGVVALLTVSALGLLPWSGFAQAPDTGSIALLSSVLVTDGIHEIAFPVRDGVEFCSGGGLTIHGPDGDGTWIRTGRSRRECQSDEAVARFETEDGGVMSLDLIPREDARSPAAIRTVTGPEAAGAFLALAARTDRGRVGDDAVLGAAIARDAGVWPDLLAIARTPDLPRRTRSSAVFWVGRHAADQVAGDLADLAGSEAEDMEIREAAVFALSQLDGGVGRVSLMEIARSDVAARIRRTAFFWLAEGAEDDPGVLAFFEEVLSGQ